MTAGERRGLALVTGATGFVGSAVVRQALEAGLRVRVLVRPGSDRRNLAGLPVETAQGDLRDRASLERALRGCTFLFHVAADYRLWVRKVDEMLATNVGGTRELMGAALEEGVERVVYTSSVATLGTTPDGRPADEESAATLTEMVGPYKRSKFLAEAEVRRLVGERGLPAVIVNPSTPVGPRDLRPTPTGRLIVDAAAGRMPAYVDTGLNLVHVDDVAAGHLLALERGRVGQRYVLGGENLTLKEILERLAPITGRRAPRLRLPHGLVLPLAYLSEAWARWSGGRWEPRTTVAGVKMAKKRMFFSSAKARRELGYRARPVDEALREAVEWFRRNGYCP
ncbi:MAG: NAD-dependent epimerase/dehydratase family protein [Deferrisomatales bacterium]